ncbi:MAG: hypothetical protein KFF77_00685 [Bacteroidetes bacterium]|nr:hypothetical protein [Bacteroidota bacterium]
MADSGNITHGIAADPPQGLASSIDSLHFIPAEALQSNPGPVLETVDVADLVREVRRAFGQDEGSSPVIPENGLPESATSEDVAIADEDIAITDEDIAISDEDVALMDDVAISDEDIAITDEDITITDEDVAITEEDPLSDFEMFHRNRDQLYHPPAEPSRRKLMLTAFVLTFCVLAIIVYLLLDKSEPHQIPGRPAVGEQVVSNGPLSHV